MITVLLCLLPIIAGVLLWDRLPDQVAVHFDVHNQPDRWASKGFAVFGLPALVAGIELICVGATALDPKKRNISDKAMKVVLWMMPALSWITSYVIYAVALGKNTDVGVIVCVLLGLIFIALGNYMPKIKQSYSLGFKLAWTLNDENNWNHTHRFAGFVFVICGVLFIAAGLLKFLWALAVLLFIMVLAPVLYSYIWYRRHLGESEAD